MKIYDNKDSYQKFKGKPGHINCFQESKRWIISLIVILISFVEVGQSVEGQHHGRQDDESNGNNRHNLKIAKVCTHDKVSVQNSFTGSVFEVCNKNTI